MKNADYQRLERMQEYCSDIQQALERLSCDFQAFCNDKDVRTAIVMYIAQIGELSAGLSGEFKKNEGAPLPWGMIKSMRNIIVHEYHKVDLETIWETATLDIPMMANFCNTILPSQQ